MRSGGEPHQVRRAGTGPTVEVAAVLRIGRRSKYRFSKPIAPSNIIGMAPANLTVRSQSGSGMRRLSFSIANLSTNNPHRVLQLYSCFVSRSIALLIMLSGIIQGVEL